MAAVAMVLMQTVFRLSVGPAPALIVLAVLVLAAVRPSAALLVVAATGPIAGTTLLVVRSGPDWLRFGEALTLAFIAGCAASRVLRVRPLDVEPRVFWCAAALLTAAVGSAILSLMTIAAEHPERTLLDTVRQVIARDYLRRADPFSAALLFSEGLVLLLLAADISSNGRREAVLRMLVVGASAAALLNLLRLVVAAVGREHPWTAFAGYLASVRIAINFVDVNAAGSYFAMMLFIALGLAHRGWRPAPAGIILIILGLWISGSRVAMAAVLITATLAGAMVVVRQSTHRKAMAAAALAAAVALVALAGWRWYPQGRNLDPAYALSFRVEMARAALQLTRTAPFFGVGLGEFQPRSAQYASVPENAHNNFLQVMAELGIPALVLFVAVIGWALRQEWRRANEASQKWGLCAGLTAFLLTCLGGHPLLVPPAAYAFWIALGVAGAGAGSPGDDRRGVRRMRLTAIAMIGFLIAVLPFRVAAVSRRADLEHAAIGFAHLWEHEADGLPYRWAGGQCAFFVSTSARAVAIPLRAAPTGPAAVEVRIMIDGREADRVLLAASQGWRTVRLEFVARTSARFSRVDLETRVQGTSELLTQQPTNSSGALMVGRPAVGY